MSALGQERTCVVHQPMSALPPKADICGANRSVHFGPKAELINRLCLRLVCKLPRQPHGRMLTRHGW